MSTISDNLQRIRIELAAAAQASGRGCDSVRLLAVSKTVPADAVTQAFAAGQLAFGENYVQEGVGKILQLGHTHPDIEWHMIGPVQSNKSRDVAEHFDWVHSVDRPKIAERLNAQRPPDLQPLQVCIQVNIDDSRSKSGVQAAALLPLAVVIAQHSRLRLRGMMVMPDPSSDSSALHDTFRQARQLFDLLRSHHPGCDTLSMGMSGDLRAAVYHGSTLVRVGRGIFGQRAQPPV